MIKWGGNLGFKKLDFPRIKYGAGLWRREGQLKSPVAPFKKGGEKESNGHETLITNSLTWFVRRRHQLANCIEDKLEFGSERIPRSLSLNLF